MYIHPLNSWEDEPDVRDFIKKNGFATLYTQIKGKPWATHLPVYLEKQPEGNWVIHFHLARANAQAQVLTEVEGEVLLVVQGPHAYISSSWYTHENVPTWNYLAVHVYGKVRQIEGKELLHHLSSLVDQYETGRPNRVQVETMSPGYLEGQLRALVGFELEITEIQASAKLSQNRDDENYERIVQQLQDSPLPGNKEVAAEMRKRRQTK